MKRLKVEITNKFGSQRKFAKVVGIHESTISNIILDAMAPSDSQKEVIEKALDRTWEELIEEI